MESQFLIFKVQNQNLNMRISPLIEIDELLKIYSNPNVMIFDASNNKNARINYENNHLNGAYFVDINAQLADIKNDFSDGGRHPLPTIQKFAKTLTDLRITNEKHIVIYDDNDGSNAAARFWWMLKSIGHVKVQVLNGGLAQAKKYNFPFSSEIEPIQKLEKPYQFDQWKLPTINIQEIENILNNPNYLIVDVRDTARFQGKTEPIDLIAGHIPSAINIPFKENLDENGCFISQSELVIKYKKAFENIKTENIVVHCGSGVTACHTLLALDYAEMDIPKLYVGSWSEWSRNNKKIETTTV